jgi:antitoxin (DNA-binding transcriptional repressor) of toxin-antitoxin stability system
VLLVEVEQYAVVADAQPVQVCRPEAHHWQVDEVASRSYLRDVHAVGLKILKNRLSEYVRLAASGETILVTDRERVVAELGPPRGGGRAMADDVVLLDAVRRGWLTPAMGAPDERVPRRPVATLDRLLTELDDDRADR